MNCPHYTTLEPKNRARKPRLAIGRSAARLATAPSTNATSTPFNFLDYPTDVVLLVVFWRLRYTLSLRDLAEMFW